MADISFPDSVKQPATVEWGLRSNTWAFTSPLTGSVRTVGVPGARWVAVLNWPAMNDVDAAPLQSLLLRLRGMENRLLMHYLTRPVPRGPASGTPVISGAGQVGSTVVLSGLPVSTLIYKVGDLLGIGGELKMVAVDSISNSSGQMNVTFEPPLRASPPNGSAIVTTRPQARFVPTDNSVRWINEPAKIVTGFALELAEAFT